MPGKRNVDLLCLMLGALLALAVQPSLAGAAGTERQSNETTSAQTCAPPDASSSSPAVSVLGGQQGRTAFSPALAAGAERANQLRERLRDLETTSAGNEETRTALILETRVLGDELAALDPEPQLPRVIAHLERTLVGLDPALEFGSGKSSNRLVAARWLIAALPVAQQFNDSEHAALLRVRLADLYEADGRLDEAMQLNRQAILDASRARSGAALYRAHWRIGRIHEARGESALALDAYRSAVEILETMRAELASISGDREFAFRRQVEPVYLALVDLLLRSSAASNSSAPGDPDRQAALREARDTIERLKIAELREYFRDECLDAQSTVVPDDVPGSVVVYPILLIDRVEIIVGRDGVLSAHRAGVAGPDLEQAARKFRRSLEDRTLRSYRPRGAQLYDWLIRPIESRLEGEIDTLVFVPSGALRSIPIAALRDRETDRFLIERFPIAVAPSLRLTEPRMLDRSITQLLAGALTESVQGFAPLPNVAIEVSAIEETFTTRALVDQAFQTQPFVDSITTTPFDIVHIASHGEFSTESSESFILTHDGRISIDRLSESILTTRFREDHPLEMLILSACETAAGDDRAALGLAGVAVRSGARSVMATLWSVNDAASSELVASFYRRLASQEVSRARALQQAQIELLSQKRLSHPALWAPFVLIGSWL